MKDYLFIHLMKISWIATKVSSLPAGGHILARNQKVPSAREPRVSSLAVSHYLPHRCDQDAATAQTLAQNDDWGQKQWVERDTIWVWQALWCEQRRPLITAALSFVPETVLSLQGRDALQEGAASFAEHCRMADSPQLQMLNEPENLQPSSKIRL